MFRVEIFRNGEWVSDTGYFETHYAAEREKKLWVRLGYKARVVESGQWVPGRNKVKKETNNV